MVRLVLQQKRRVLSSIISKNRNPDKQGALFKDKRLFLQSILVMLQRTQNFFFFHFYVFSSSDCRSLSAFLYDSSPVSFLFSPLFNHLKHLQQRLPNLRPSNKFQMRHYHVLFKKNFYSQETSRFTCMK